MKLKYFLPLILCLAFLAGCNDNDDDWWHDSSREVDDVKINARKAHPGDIIIVDTYFETTEEFGVPKDLELVIKLDPEIQYVNGSSKLYVYGDGHKRSPDTITTCDDGSVFLWYSLDNDKDLRYYTGDKDFDMRFEIVAAAPAKMAKIRAQAGKTVKFSCEEEFLYEEEDGLIIE